MWWGSEGSLTPAWHSPLISCLGREHRRRSRVGTEVITLTEPALGLVIDHIPKGESESLVSKMWRRSLSESILSTIFVHISPTSSIPSMDLSCPSMIAKTEEKTDGIYDKIIRDWATPKMKQWRSRWGFNLALHATASFRSHRWAVIYSDWRWFGRKNWHIPCFGNFKSESVRIVGIPQTRRSSAPVICGGGTKRSTWWLCRLQ